MGSVVSATGSAAIVVAGASPSPPVSTNAVAAPRTATPANAAKRVRRPVILRIRWTGGLGQRHGRCRLGEQRLETRVARLCGSDDQSYPEPEGHRSVERCAFLVCRGQGYGDGLQTNDCPVPESSAISGRRNMAPPLSTAKNAVTGPGAVTLGLPGSG